MKILLSILIAVVFFSISSTYLLENSAFAQMESMSITGYQYPEVNSVFNVNLNVQGTSRASGGLFDVHMTIYQKDKPTWLMEQGVKEIYSGTNKLTIDLGSGKNPYKPNVSYILEAQHAAIITTFEFIPIDKSLGIPPPPIESTSPTSPLQKLEKENQELKKQIQQKDAIILEQIKVIQNLASMMKKTIFEPILNYVNIF